jgi:hypothetical protein
MTHHEGTPEPARNPTDLLGGPDRSEYGTEFGGPDPIGQKDVLGGADPDRWEDELRPPAGAGGQRSEESRITHGHREGHHG